MFHHQLKHREESLKYDAQQSLFLTKFEVFHLVMKHCVECLILLIKQNYLEGEVKGAKLSSFSSDFQTLIKH